GERPPYRGNSDRPSGGNDRAPYRGNSDRPAQGEHPPYRGNSDRPSGGNDRAPYRGNSDRPAQGERPPYRGNSDRPAQGERPPYRGNSDRPAQGERPPYRGNSDRPAQGGDRKPWAKDGARPERSDRPSSDRPRSDNDSKPWTQRGGSPNRAGAPRVDAGKKLWTRDGAPARNDRDARVVEEEMTEEQRMQRELRSVRPRHDDPELPDDISANDLDRIARNELKTLTKENAETVGRHLAMAARVIDEDPQLAHRHVMSAARRAGRIGVVRESLAITAYATGDFALALRELRTYRRISGSNDQLPLMVDSERGVGRPDRALELGRSVDRSTLSPSVQVGLAIAMSGARLDLGEADAALVELEIPQLNPTTAFSYSPELFAAYAEVLSELGREDEADVWLERASRADAALGASGADDETIEIEEMEDDDDDALASFAADAGDDDDDDDNHDEVVDDADDIVAEAVDTAETDDESEPDVASPKA
ncbi:proline-rich domain-containing protein, partial [Cryobacterium sp. Hz9]|uniref:proline-rich domain-containing protein n=1 Tax=Cryobacterium sp. Hz9 TaxID=1259167 RepID=UPI001F542465